MTPKIDQQIAQIKSLFHQLKAKNEQEITARITMEATLSAHTEEMDGLKLRIQQLLQENERLTVLVSTNTKQVVEPKQEGFRSRTNEEIDALIKEIDFCIAQLKHNNG